MPRERGFIRENVLMQITINDVIAIESWERVKELFNGRESVTAKDIAAATIIPLQGRAWLLSHLLGPRDVKREVARRIARDVLGDRDIPQAYRVWLDTGDEAFQKGALDAVCVVADVAASDAVLDTAWVAADSAVPYPVYAAANAAANAAADFAADVAVGAVADPAAWCAVAWATAMERYIGWMAEWLDSYGMIKWSDVDVYDADIYEEADLVFAKLGDLIRDAPAFFDNAVVIEGKIVEWLGFSLSHDTEDINWEGFPIKNADGRKRKK
jgi:hypothetical protein